MEKSGKNDGFSLLEVLMAVGILAVGMLFIAGVFPVAIHLSTIATEQTMASVAAEEAFAKVRIFGRDDPCVPNDNINLSKLHKDELMDFNSISDVFPMVKDMQLYEFAYPSTGSDIKGKQYYWSALCRLIDEQNRLVQVTVFVSRKTSPDLKYYDPHYSSDVSTNGKVWPMVGEVDWPTAGKNNELRIDIAKEVSFINDGCTLVDNETGEIYRVLKRYPYPNDDTIVLDKDWKGGAGSDAEVWVVPPPVAGGRSPCVAVYQKIIRF